MHESEASIACGIVRRWLVEHWWPGDDVDTVVQGSLYLDVWGGEPG